ECGAEIVEEHDAEARVHGVERRLPEGVYLGISQRERDRRPSRDELPRAREHRRRYVDAEHVPGGTGEIGQLHQGVAAPAAHVEDPLARDDAQTLDRDAPQGFDERVRAVLHAGPCLAPLLDERLACAWGIGRAHEGDCGLGALACRADQASRIAPTVTYASARLNTGQCGTWTKSTTYPRAMRSRTFPA